MSYKQSPRPQWKTTALHSAIAAFCANGLLITQAQADALCGPTISVNQEQCVAEDSQDIVVDSGVIISTTDEAAVLYMGNLGFTEGGEDTYGSLTNNGSILSSGTGEDLGGLNSVAGVAIQGELLGTLTNTGVISGTSSGTSGSYAFGIREGGGPFMQGTIRNSGTISASSTSTHGSAEALAVYIVNSIAADALIENLAGGSINATATAPNSSGVAIGLAAQNFYGTLTNHGEISAMVNAQEGIAAGVLTYYFAGTLNNHGTIAGTSADGGEGYSILTFGSEGPSTINNMQGGVLSGRLHLGGDVNISNAGLIDLPMLADAGYVGGNFTQTETGTLRIMAAGSGEDEYSTLRVDGIATIAGNAFVDVKEINTLAVGQTLSRVVSAYQLTGNFAQVEDNSALFNFRSLATQGEDGYIDFELVKALTAVEAVNANNNPVARGAAGALDSIIDSGTSNANMQAVINALGSLGTSQEVSDAVSQTLPLLAGSSAIASSAALTGINRVIQSRIESNRGMSSGDTFYGDHKVWLKPFGSLADQNDRNGAPGYEANVGGLALGIDGTVSDTTRLGVAFAYAKADIDGNSKVAPNSAEVDVFQLLGYGSHSLDSNMELNFQAGVGQNNTAGKRDILFLGETAKADYSSLVTTAGVGLGRTYKLNESTDFTPSVRTDYTWIKDEGYTEKGSSANLKVDSRSTDELILGLDGKLSHEFMPGTNVTANLGVGYDALNSQTSITSAFAGEPGVGFTTRGLEPSPWLQRAGLGLTTNTDNGVEISLRYDAEHRESFLNQTASVKLRWDI
jgi:outer membrane autotransporter protein